MTATLGRVPHTGQQQRGTSHSSAPLPDAVQSVLTAIAADLRHIPRENCASIPDILMYVRRQANRVDGVRGMKVFAGPKPPPRPQAAPQAPVSPREAAEVVFGAGRPLTAKRVARRTVSGRKGRSVVVETRQLQLFGAQL